MRVVIVSGIYPPDIGGPATHSEGLRRELAERGHRVIVLTLWDGPCVSSRPGLIRFPRRWSWSARQIAVAVWLAGHRDSYDVVYATGLHPAAVAGARLARRPVVVKVVGDPVWERGQRLGLTTSEFLAFQRSAPKRGRLGAMRWLRDWSLRNATGITTPNGFLADVVEEWLGGPSDVSIVPNGVHVNQGAARVLDTAAGNLRVIFVGRLIPLKRVGRLIAAVAETVGVTLEIVGSGPETERLQIETDMLDVRDRVTFHGDVPHERVLRLVSGADVLALASDIEGLPHVALEAFATGTPVVSPAVGGVGEVLCDGHNGLVLPDTEVPTIASALARLRDDEHLRRDLRRGAAISGAEWTSQRTADQIEALFRRISRGRPRIVMLGRSSWPPALGAGQRRKLELMLPHESPIFVQAGRLGVRHVGRARVVALPVWGSFGGAAFYALGPLVAAGLTIGRQHAAIMCQSPYEGVGAVLLTRLVPRPLRPRVIVELHGDWRTASGGYGAAGFRDQIAPLADRAAQWALQRADVVRVVSAFTEELARIAGVRGSVQRFMAYTDAEALLDAPLVTAPSDPRAAYVGALERVKGIDVLLEAWRTVRRRIPGARLVVAGDGALRDVVAREAAGLGVEIIGHVPSTQVVEVMDGARFIVVPSRSEGLGRVVWEAFARGRPVVGTSVGGIPESVDHGRTGILVPPEDAEALADAIVGAFEDEVATARMGAWARRVAEERDPDREFEEGIARLAAWVGGR